SLTVRSLIDALADSLRERVFTELTPGALVGESEVSRKYEVARPTAKAAIERLVQEGLLRRDAHRSARVPVIGSEDAEDLYFTRSCLESEVMRRLATTATVPDTAEQAIRELAAAATGRGLSNLVEPDIRFHRTLVDALGSPRLSRMHAGIMGEMRLCMVQVQAHHLLDPAVIVAEHTDILKAIADGAANDASAVLVAHLDRARALLTNDLRSPGDS
ncbi:MAG: GntR family transcriptional regulator, partial [Sciscionella sp.]